jgi:hypothetical protein
MLLQADRARRWHSALALASVLLLAACGRVSSLIPGSAPAVPTADMSDAQRIALVRGRTSSCRFVHGFAEAHSTVPEVIGDCIENERADPTSGDTLQRTTRGLLVWRKADGLIAFTDGHRTWVRGPDGLVRVRTNDERFTWEAAPAGPSPPPLRVVTPGPPVSSAVPPAAGTPSPGATPAGPPNGGPGAAKPTSSSEPPKPLPLSATPAAKP